MSPKFVTLVSEFELESGLGTDLETDLEAGESMKSVKDFELKEENLSGRIVQLELILEVVHQLIALFQLCPVWQIDHIWW